MSRCYCRVALSILVIVFAWLTVSWAKYVLTVLGIILAIQALAGICCCTNMKEEKKEASENPESP
jgi:general stress protein CsbA